MEHTNSLRLAAEIRAEAARQGVTAASLSVSTDIPRSTMSRKLSGASDLSVGEAASICSALGVSLSDLVRRAEDMAAAS